MDTRVQRCFWGEGRGWAFVNWKTPHNCNLVLSTEKIAVQCMFSGNHMHYPLAVYSLDSVKLLINNMRQVVGYTKRLKGKTKNR